MRLRGLISKEVDSAKKSGNDQATLDRGKLRMINSFKAVGLLGGLDVNHPSCSTTPSQSPYAGTSISADTLARRSRKLRQR